MNFQKVKAAIFDLDGTLLDTLADIGTGANFALCQFGYEPYPIEAYRMKVGHGIKNLFRCVAVQIHRFVVFRHISVVVFHYHHKNLSSFGFGGDDNEVIFP